jgi:hypothetical protein
MEVSVMDSLRTPGSSCAISEGGTRLRNGKGLVKFRATPAPMKNLICWLMLLSLLLSSGQAEPDSAGRAWAGAWRGTDGTTERVLLIVDGYFTHTSFERANPQFHRTFGGPLEFQAAGATILVHFDSAEPARVGKAVALGGELNGTELRLRLGDGDEEIWRRIEESPGELTGVWRISGRQRDGQIQPMPLAARRTLKMLW